MNRQQRRAAERRRTRVLSGFHFSVTPDETAVLEEALALWLYQTDRDLPDERTPEQAWALRRGEKLRQAFAAALEDRPWKDLAPEREKPEGGHEQGQLLLRGQG